MLVFLKNSQSGDQWRHWFTLNHNHTHIFIELSEMVRKEFLFRNHNCFISSNFLIFVIISEYTNSLPFLFLGYSPKYWSCKSRQFHENPFWPWYHNSGLQVQTWCHCCCGFSGYSWSLHWWVQNKFRPYFFTHSFNDHHSLQTNLHWIPLSYIEAEFLAPWLNITAWYIHVPPRSLSNSWFFNHTFQGPHWQPVHNF